MKHLDSIQNLGAMDILCTDKTGTLTLDRIILERHCDVLLRDDPEVLRMGWLVSHFQTGLRSAMDRAVLDHESLRGHEPTGGGTKLDEADALAAEGFRVLAVAYRDVEARRAYGREDEKELVLRGYLAFLDPPKDSARGALDALAACGVDVKVLTGDNEFVATKICREVFVNILKYVRMGTSSNFGNMLSVVAASAVLPFVPMTPLQILTTNLLYDCSQVPIPGDHVDAELVAAPRRWSTGQIARFILCVGPVSSLFDFTTFAVLWLVFGCDDPEHAAVFHTGWIE